MADRGRFSVKGIKDIYTKGWEVKNRNNLVTLWYTSNRTWKKVEDNRISDEELVMAKSNKRYRKICGWLWYVSKNKK